MHKINLSIPKPCHENWDQMTPADQGRYCGSCKKTVIDFSNMSDSQLAAFFKKPIGSVCGRFQKDQLERELSIPAKRIPWLRYFFQILLPAFLLSLKAQGQKSVRMGRVASHSTIAGNKTQGPQPEVCAPNKIAGKVSDEKGNLIPSATIMIKGTNQGVVSDASGRFELLIGKELPITLKVSCIGFEALEYKVTDAAANELVLKIGQQQLAGEVVVVGYVQRPNKNIPLMGVRKKDTAFQHFVVYPNPIRSNVTVTIESKKLDKGNCLVQITTMDGKAICTKPVVLERKGDLIRLDMPALTPGAYLLSISNERSKKVYTEKIQVQ